MNSLSIQLPPDVALILSAVADEQEARPAELAARVLANWAGRCDRLIATENEAAMRLSVRRHAARRLSILQLWWDARRQARGRSIDQATGEFLRELKKRGEGVDRSTLYNWEHAWSQHGIDGLIDRRRLERPAPEPGPFLLEVRRLYRSARQPMLSSIWRNVTALAKVKGWEKKSYKATQRFIASSPNLRSTVEPRSKEVRGKRADKRREP